MRSVFALIINCGYSEADLYKQRIGSRIRPIVDSLMRLESQSRQAEKGYSFRRPFLWELYGFSSSALRVCLQKFLQVHHYVSLSILSAIAR